MTHSSVPLDETTQGFLRILADHQKVKPDHDEGYAANVEWIALERTAWQRTDDALRLIVGKRLVARALGEDRP